MDSLSTTPECVVRAPHPGCAVHLINNGSIFNRWLHYWRVMPGGFARAGSFLYTTFVDAHATRFACCRHPGFVDVSRRKTPGPPWHISTSVYHMRPDLVEASPAALLYVDCKYAAQTDQSTVTTSSSVSAQRTDFACVCMCFVCRCVF